MMRETDIEQAYLAALEEEFYLLDFSPEPWTQADLDRQAEILRILSENGVLLG